MQNFVAFDVLPHLLAGLNTAMCMAADSAVVTAACGLVVGSQRTSSSCIALGAAIATSIGMRKNARTLIAYHDRILDSLTRGEKSRLRKHLADTAEALDPISVLLGAPTRRERPAISTTTRTSTSCTFFARL